jgi:mannosyl-3-phosphoglycerate phosphatase
MLSLQDSLLVITDLDGSLLDHHTYSWQAAEAWLARLEEHEVPLVICSSKTAAEIVPLQKQLGIEGTPFIAENGARIHLTDPAGEPVVNGDARDYSDIVESLRRLEHQFRFTGFADFSDKEISDITGLTLRDAQLARIREASEALVWRDSEEQFDRFREALAADGLSLTQGGRFWHVMATGSGKGAAVSWLLDQLPQRPVTLGLGDGPNDAPMLDVVDYAVVIKGYSKNPVVLQRTDEQRVYHTAHHGPQGWSEGLDYFITQP